MATSLLSRKRDLAYFIYFIIHFPIMFIIDLQTLYPPSLTPAISTTIKKWFITTYQDQFFVAPPPFFVLFMWMEVFFHVPVCVWAVRALWNDDRKTPLVLLIYGLQTLLTTAVCIADYASWTLIDTAAKWNLSTLYGPYLILAIFMSTDMSLRLNAIINTAASATGSKKNL